MTDRQFPILDDIRRRLPRLPMSVPWELLAPHEKQARRNHDQSLERLAERGGLSWSEIDFIITDKPWDWRMFNLPDDEAEFTACEAAAAVRVIRCVRELKK